MAEKQHKISLILDAVDRITSPIKKATSAQASLSEAVKNSRAELKKLGDLQRDIEHFGKLTDKLKQNEQALEEARTQWGRLEREISKGGATKELTEQLNRAKNKVKDMTAAVTEQRSELSAAAAKLQAAGVATANYKGHLHQVKQQAEALNKALAEQRAKLQAVTEAQARYDQARAANRATRSEIVGEAIGTAGVLYALGTPVRQALKFEAAMAGVAKAVDGLRDSTGKLTPEYDKMSAGILDLTTRIPIAADELSAIVQAGGAAGLADGLKIPEARKELLRFGESAAKMGVAFDISAAEAGQTMAEWRSAFRLNQTQVEELADQINYLDNTTAASAKKISSVVSAIGPLGEAAGVTSGQLAAFGATLIGMGVKEDVAATGIKNMMLTMNAGYAATKAQKEAFDELGLSATDVAARMQTDAKGAILDVLEALKQLPDDRRVATMTELFGRESVSAIAPLLNNTQALADNLTKVAEASQYSGSMLKEFGARAGTDGNKLQLMANKAARTAITIGKVLQPSVSYVADKLGALFDLITRLATEFPVLTQVIMMTVIGLIALKLAMLGTRYAGTLLSDGLLVGTKALRFFGVGAETAAAKTLALRGAALASGAATRVLAVTGISGLATKLAGLAAGALPAATSGFAAFGAALLANPIFWVVAIIAGLALLIVKFWQPIKAFFSGFWDGFTTGLAPITEKLKPLGEVVSWIGDGISALVGWFGDLLTPAEYSAETLGDVASAGETAGRVLAAAFELVLYPLTQVANAIGMVSDAWDYFFGDDETAKKAVELSAKVTEKTGASKPAVAAALAVPLALSPVYADEGATAPVLPPMVQTGAATPNAGKGMTIHEGDSIFQIHAAPGMDERQLASLVDQKLDERDRKRARQQRGMLYDQ